MINSTIIYLESKHGSHTNQGQGVRIRSSRNKESSFIETYSL